MTEFLTKIELAHNPNSEQQIRTDSTGIFRFQISGEPEAREWSIQARNDWEHLRDLQAELLSPEDKESILKFHASFEGARPKLSDEQQQKRAALL